jgi:translation initiation factor IF-3
MRNNNKNNKKDYGPRRNEKIRIPKILVIYEPTGDSLGVMDTKDALELAKNKGLDLVEIAPHAKPPVCKIMDYGKFVYQQSKKEKKNKQVKQKIKEIQLSYNIGENDLNIKAKKAKEFIEDGAVVKINLKMSGRELQFKDIAMEVVNNFIARFEGVLITKKPQASGKTIQAQISPKKK